MRRVDTGILQFFAGYDFFGKSVPGAVFLLGLISLLPKEQITGSGVQNIDFISIAALLVVLLLAGLTLGQGIHTFADNFEKAFLWFAKQLRTSYNKLKKWFINTKILMSGWKGQIHDYLLETNFFGKIFNNYWIGKQNALQIYDNIVEFARNITWGPLGWIRRRFRGAYKWFYRRIRGLVDWSRNRYSGTFEWIRRRYWGAYDSLAGHRYLFAKWVQWNFSKENNHRWETETKGPLFDRFIDSYNEKFDVELRLHTPSEIVDQYALITSFLEKSNQTRFRQFQSIYSFCRSMWVVSLFISAIYVMALIDIAFIPDLFEHRPIIYQIDNQYRPFVPASTLLATLVFFDASGTYKRHFVEYLMGSFVQAVEEENGTKGADETTSMGIQRIRK